jgi:hypothetical protein
MVKTLLSKFLILLMYSTTLERIIVIFAMISGVMGFYFVLSDINAVVSNAIRKDIEFSAKLSMLEKIQAKYTLTQGVYKDAKISLYEDEFKVIVLDLEPFFKKFPSSIREDLKYNVNSKKLKMFPLFWDLDRSIMNTLGDCLTETVIEPSKGSFYVNLKIP